MYKKSLGFKIFSIFSSLNFVLQPIFDPLIFNRVPLVFAQEGASEEITLVEEQITEEEIINDEKASEEESNNNENEETSEEELTTQEGQSEPTPTEEKVINPSQLNEALEEQTPQEEPSSNPDPDQETNNWLATSWLEEENPETKGSICLETESAFTRTTNNDWVINEKENFAQTLNSVQLGITYTYPQEERVTVTFTCLPKDENLRAPLRIQKVRIADLNLPENYAPYGEYAYEITTQMENGTFEYQLTLPGPTEDDLALTIAYLEEEGNVSRVEIEKIEQEADTVRATELNHFTPFFVLLNNGNVKVRLCHATASERNPYRSITVSINSVQKCEDVRGHGGHTNDIIPPFPFGDCSYPGKNWDDDGRAIWENYCEIIPTKKCRNGIVEGGEDCDYGALNGKPNSNCSFDCKWITPACVPGINVVTNGSFDSPEVTSPFLWDIFSSHEVPGWTASWHGGSTSYPGSEYDFQRPSPKIEIHAGANGWGSTADQHVELDSDWDGPGGDLNGEPASISLYQKIPTIAGKQYTLSWDYSPRPGHSNNQIKNNQIKVEVNNEEVFESLVLAGEGTINWQTETETFIAKKAFTEIRFTEIGNPDSLGMFLNSVKMECLLPPIEPFCGDGKINQETEECDGEDGVAEDGSNFCTESCKLVDNPVTIVAHKIVCKNESFLPNWGEGIGAPGKIDVNTAQDFVEDSNKNCWFEENWDFQWGPADSGYGGDTLIGPVEGGKWKTFGPTDINGKTQVKINDLSTVGGRIEVREILKEGYVPFTFATSGGNNLNNVSAGIYCYEDVANYDNWEWINNPQYGQTYYCIAFNAPITSSISGYKWEDLNGDGDWGENENPLGNWTIRLKQEGDVLATKITSTGNGSYSFEGITPGKYEVCEVLKEGWKQTYPISEENTNNDVACHSVTLGLEEITDLNFGNIQYGSVRVYKFNDFDANGLWDEGEIFLSGWEITLAQETKITNDNGEVFFTKLVPGQYDLSETLKEGWIQTGLYCQNNNPEVIGINSNHSQATVVSTLTTVCYIGNFQLGRISGYKIYDRNNNGSQEEGEGGVEGWEICLTEEDLEDENCVETDSDGYYEFTGLTAGVYTVTEEDRSANGWQASNPESGKHENILVFSGTGLGEDFQNYNFYNAPPASLTLVKSNNATGSVNPGSEIKYTLTITVGERTLSSLELIDILPHGFTYQAGTSTVSVNGVNASFEPTVRRTGRRLSWKWPNGVEGGSTIIVTYLAKIDPNNQPATFTNHAYVYGYGSPTLIESKIVDSSVRIDPEHRVGDRTVGGQVLGVTTEVESKVLGLTLPAAGANTWYLIAALTLISTGLAMSPKKKKFENN